jgi:uncharacterized membrane protein YkoI
MKTQIMNKLLVLGFSSFVFAGNASANDALGTCIAAVQKEKPGVLRKLEKLNVSGKPFYELEGKDSAGLEWEFMCDAKGKITERESEVKTADDPAFKAKMKVSEADAKATALKAYPGTIKEVEYEIEANGDGSYEIDIVSDKGVQTKVEVDALSGKIIETSIEAWEIGEE